MRQNNDPFFIFEIANNHQGDLSHGFRIIDEMARISRKHSVRSAVKLQYRNLKTFIHPEFYERSDIKHVDRFKSTELGLSDYHLLCEHIKANEMEVVITAFDEFSVDNALDHGVDRLKVASCSANDWPLLEKIARAGKPIVLSTGGLSLQGIDSVVTFFEHRGVKNLDILYCIGIYPTEDAQQQLGFLDRLGRRFPEYGIGYSGHERPSNLLPGQMAAAMGAGIFERHVGVRTNDIPLNGYSLDPEEVDRWVGSVVAAIEVCGERQNDRRVHEDEIAAMNGLRRGVFANRSIETGEPIFEGDVFFAFPWIEGSMSTFEWSEGMTASRDYSKGDPIFEKREIGGVRVLRQVVHEAKGFLREAGIPLGGEYQIELSHHYGMEKFRRFGAIIIDFFNREYCKKLIVLLPGQSHPSHYHEQKEETFQVLSGDLKLLLDGQESSLIPGDFQLIERGKPHAFSTENGVVFEEISTTHVVGDSFYEDHIISALDPIERKSVIERW